jgi:hypothetical protein
MTKILHLTHTDITSDSRILKEMNCINNSHNMWVINGMGVQLGEETHNTKENSSLNICSINLISRRWRSLPTPLRHTCSLVELMIHSEVTR